MHMVDIRSATSLVHAVEGNTIITLLEEHYTTHDTDCGYSQRNIPAAGRGEGGGNCDRMRTEPPETRQQLVSE